MSFRYVEYDRCTVRKKPGQLGPCRRCYVRPAINYYFACWDSPGASSCETFTDERNVITVVLVSPGSSPPIHRVFEFRYLRGARRSSESSIPFSIRCRATAVTTLPPVPLPVPPRWSTSSWFSALIAISASTSI